MFRSFPGQPGLLILQLEHQLYSRVDLWNVKDPLQQVGWLDIRECTMEIISFGPKCCLYPCHRRCHILQTWDQLLGCTANFIWSDNEIIKVHLHDLPAHSVWFHSLISILVPNVFHQWVFIIRLCSCNCLCSVCVLVTQWQSHSLLQRHIDNLSRAFLKISHLRLTLKKPKLVFTKTDNKSNSPHKKEWI